MDKFEQKEMEKIRSVKSPWYDWLTDNISVPRRKSAGDFKYEVISLFKANTLK